MPDVTIAIVPREKFSCATASLASLLANTPRPFELIYVDGGAPQATRDEIDALLAAEQHVMRRIDRYLGPFEAMGIAIAETKTTYVVIADNDVYFRPGWLEALLACAVEENSDVVAPLVLIGEPDSVVIHVAGGIACVAAESGHRWVRHEQYLEHRQIDEPALRLDRTCTQLVESHCLLARTDALRALGPLDPTIGHSVNVDELSLRLAMTNASVWFEPAAQVVYLYHRGMSLDRHDIALMNRVWSEQWARRDRQLLADRYALDEPQRHRRHVEWWLADHRRLWLWPVRDWLERTFAMLRAPGLGSLLWKVVERAEVGLNRLFMAGPSSLDADEREIDHEANSRSGEHAVSGAGRSGTNVAWPGGGHSNAVARETLHRLRWPKRNAWYAPGCDAQALKADREVDNGKSVGSRFGR